MNHICVIPETNDIFILEGSEEYYFNTEGERIIEGRFKNVKSWKKNLENYIEAMKVKDYYFFVTNRTYTKEEDFYDEFPEFRL